MGALGAQKILLDSHGAGVICSCGLWVSNWGPLEGKESGRGEVLIITDISPIPKDYFYLCVSVCLCTCVWTCQQMLLEDMRCPGMKLQAIVSHPAQVLKPTLGPLGEHKVLLTTKPSLQTSPSYNFKDARQKGKHLLWFRLPKAF